MIGHSFTYGTLYIIQTEQSHVWLLKGWVFFPPDRSQQRRRRNDGLRCRIFNVFCDAPTISQSPTVLVGCDGGVSLPFLFGPSSREFKLASRRLFHFSNSTGNPPQGQVEMATVRGFHIHIGEVVGLQSFFVFYGPGGRVSAVCSAGITIQREVRESSEGAPVLQIKHIPHSRWPQSLTIDSGGWLFYASGHSLLTSLTSSADAAFHFHSLRRMSTL